MTRRRLVNNYQIRKFVHNEDMRISQDVVNKLDEIVSMKIHFAIMEATKANRKTIYVNDLKD